MLSDLGPGLIRFMFNNPELFKHISRDHKHNSAEEWVPIAEKLAKENGGILQSRGWLQKNGYSGLSRVLINCPKLFKHIKQEKMKRSRMEWIPIAEKLTKENGGILPCKHWLVKNGYWGLSDCIRKFPKLFKHIKQEKRGGKSPKEWIHIAEKLAKENGGILPYGRWLGKNGYNGLLCAIRTYPELFKHIKQEKRGGKSPKEWIHIAEKLAKENGGILQNSGWLQKNGYSGLSAVLISCSELFKHIKQEKRGGKPPEEWIPIAEKLAKENGGVLQNHFWLCQNQYSGLSACIKNNPEMFKHLKVEKCVKRIEEWLLIAKRLTKENGGVLPTHLWIRENGYCGLSSCILKNPEMFKHLGLRLKPQRRSKA